MSLTEILDPKMSPAAIRDLSTTYRCMFFFFKRLPLNSKFKVKSSSRLVKEQHFGPCWISARLWREWGKTGRSPMLVSLCSCVSTALVLKIHPGFLFPSITWQQKHYFISVFLPWAETPQRDSSGEDERRPTWLTYQWRVGHIPSARSVTHKWLWQQNWTPWTH